MSQNGAGWGNACICGSITEQVKGGREGEVRSRDDTFGVDYNSSLLSQCKTNCKPLVSDKWLSNAAAKHGFDQGCIKFLHQRTTWNREKDTHGLEVRVTRL